MTEQQRHTDGRPEIPDTSAITPETVTLEGIATVIGEYYTYDPEQFFQPSSKRQDSSWSDARGALYAIGLDHAELPTREIARRVSSDPPSVHRLIQRARLRAQDDPRFNAHMQDLTRAAYGEPLATTLQTWVDLASRHFDVPPEDAISPLQTDRALLTRQTMAHLFARNTTLLPDAIAHRTGLMTKGRVDAGIKSLDAKRQENPRLNEDLTQLEAGQLPNTLRREQILARVCAYYDITPEELTGPDKHHRYFYPRIVAHHLLVTEAYYALAEANVFLGKHRSTYNFKDQAELDTNLLHDIEVIRDVGSAELDRPLQQIARRVCSLYGVDPSDLQIERSTARVGRARSVIAYLAIQSGIPEWQIRRDLSCDQRSIVNMEVGLTLEMHANAYLAEEIQYLTKTAEEGISLDQRIIQRVAEIFNVSPDQVLRPGTTAAKHAQGITLYLLAERGHTSFRDLEVAYKLEHTDITYAIRRAMHYIKSYPKLRDQVQHIRDTLLSDDVNDTMPLPSQDETTHETTPIEDDTIESDRLLEELAVRFNVEVVDLISPSTVPWHRRAQSVAVKHLKKARYTPQQISDILDIPLETVVQFTQDGGRM